jgi:hypothetical protein
MAALMAGSDNDEGDVRCQAAKETASDSAHVVVQGMVLVFGDEEEVYLNGPSFALTRM